MVISGFSGWKTGFSPRKSRSHRCLPLQSLSGNFHWIFQSEFPAEFCRSPKFPLLFIIFSKTWWENFWSILVRLRKVIYVMVLPWKLFMIHFLILVFSFGKWVVSWNLILIHFILLIYGSKFGIKSWSYFYKKIRK